MHKTLKNEAKTESIYFIFYVNINNNVKTLLAIEYYPTTLENLRTVIHNIYKTPNSIPTLYSTSTATVKKRIITGFRDKIASLISQHTNLHIQQTGVSNNAKISTLNDTQALQVFKNCLNDKYRQT